MTGKRFAYVIDNGEDTIYDLNIKGGVLENFVDIEEMLNSLYEENEQLKHSIKCLEADKMELQQYIKRMQGDV